MEEHHPHITFSICMAHYLNNLLKDLGLIGWMSDTIEKGSQNVSFINRHEFMNRSQRESIQKSKSALKQFMVSDEFEKHHQASTKAGKECKKNIADSNLWERCRKIMDTGKPIIHLLRMMDSLQLCISQIYEGMDKMIEKLTHSTRR